MKAQKIFVYHVLIPFYILFPYYYNNDIFFIFLLDMVIMVIYVICWKTSILNKFDGLIFVCKQRNREPISTSIYRYQSYLPLPSFSFKINEPNNIICYNFHPLVCTAVINKQNTCL